MKRRDLILASAFFLVPTLGRTQAPCPPAQLSVAGGTSSASTPCPTGSTYSTNFATAENPLSEGGKWVDGKAVGVNWNNPQSAFGKAYASVLSGLSGSRYDDSIAHLATSLRTFAPNQYAQGTVFKASGYTTAGGHELELLLRFSIVNGNAHGYEVLWGIAGYMAVVRWNGALGDYTPVYDPGNGSIPVPQDGDVLRAEITGNIIKVYRNGVQVGPNIDVTSIGGQVWSSGQPGLGFWPVDGAVVANMGWKSYTAGDL
jgi:hypothetical protein